MKSLPPASNTSIVLGAVALMAHFAAAQPAPGPGWTTAGPARTAVTALAADPINALRLFAGTELGVFRTDDGGATWAAVPAAPPGILALAVDPKTRLWAGTAAGAFESTDGGASFVSEPSMRAIRAIAVDPTNSSIVYVGGDGPAIAKTTDGGASWTETVVGDFPALVREISQLVIDPGNTDHVLAAAEAPDYGYFDYVSPRILQSTDAGKTWWAPQEQPGGSAPYTFAFDPRRNGTVYAGTGDQVYRSADGGVTWQATPFFSFSPVTSLVADSLRPGTLYGGTAQGVFRSIDDGMHWVLLRGPEDFSVNALAFDADRDVLHAATSSGVWEYNVMVPMPPGPCQETSDSLCLLGGRFSVRLDAWNPRTGSHSPGEAVPGSDGFGYFSLPDFTGGSVLPEVVVKMVDAEVAPWNSDWVFWGSLTDVQFLVTVTDTATGEARTYANGPDAPFCGGADTSAFRSAGSGPAPARSSPRSEISGDSLSLLSGRFLVTLTATDPRTGGEVRGEAVSAGDGFGYFGLPAITGSRGTPEVFVKMVDASSFSHTFWLFDASLTNVPHTLTVTDTVTGGVRTYSNDGSFCGDSDTGIPAGGAKSP